MEPHERLIQEIGLVWENLKDTYENPLDFAEYFDRVVSCYITDKGTCVFVRDGKDKSVVWLDVVGYGFYISKRKTAEIAEILQQIGITLVKSTAATRRIGFYLEAMGFKEIEYPLYEYRLNNGIKKWKI